MPWIHGFVWDDKNVAHIARHGVAPDEVGLTRFRGQVHYAACFTRSVLSCSAGLA